MKYTFVGPHPEDLASGGPLFYGDVVENPAPADQRLIDVGWLVPVDQSAPPPPAPAVDQIEPPTPEA